MTCGVARKQHATVGAFNKDYDTHDLEPYDLIFCFVSMSFSMFVHTINITSRTDEEHWGMAGSKYFKLILPSVMTFVIMNAGN